MDNLLSQLQALAITCMGAAVTALCAYVFGWLRTKLGIEESDSNEGEIRRAALTEAGKLVVNGTVTDPSALADAANKVLRDLQPAVKAEGYEVADIKDMILGAAAVAFPPAGILKNFLK